MLVKDIDLHIFTTVAHYDGSGYSTRHGVTLQEVEIQSSQKFIVKIPVAGFVSKHGEVCNFYIHNGVGFDTFPKTSLRAASEDDYADFKTALAASQWMRFAPRVF